MQFLKGTRLLIRTLIIKQSARLINISGYVQGLGFRPFIYRLAKKHQQNGWVANENSGVRIWLEGRNSQQEQLLTDLQHQLPAFAHIEHLTSQTQALENFADFQIKSSHHQGDYSAFVLPDISPCPDCIAELFNPNSRFYHYPFISCRQCGPRYSIMQQQPYDRQHTTMADFQPCSTCWHDYHAPENRRFHAQTIACEHCGPQLQLLNPQGELLHSQHNALLEAVKHLQQGGIIALKGIGGFQLLADATQEEAVQRLRDRKNRPAKPFALMLKDMKSIKAICAVNAIEQQALRSSASPIVLLNHLANRLITQTVAPNNTQLGVMLPSSPLHHLLAYYFAKPLVVTSGNRSHEPLCTDTQQALDQLADIADFFLSHNRKITHGLDDSVVRNINNQVVNLRRARGYVPLPISIDKKLNAALAVGGHSKNTIAISHGQQLILSQHLGDLNSLASQQYFQKTLTTLTDFYHTKPKILLHD
ncbi:MAG: carbamoyltransferase HypF, partial [Planctomycetaceae bacterium]|nr:carbamoyltransferase HypF [Planctomycetaceae bacterium]